MRTEVVDEGGLKREPSLQCRRGQGRAGQVSVCRGVLCLSVTVASVFSPFDYLDNKFAPSIWRAALDMPRKSYVANKAVTQLFRTPSRAQRLHECSTVLVPYSASSSQHPYQVFRAVTGHCKRGKWS